MKISRNVLRQKKRAAGDRERKRMSRLMMASYSRTRKNIPVEEAPSKSVEDSFEINDIVNIPDCAGVGDCCKNRVLPVDPSDVFRILNNSEAIKKWDIETTEDLYGVGKPLIYDVDAKSGIPGCATLMVEDVESGNKACPFLDIVKNECILGDDKLTYCKSAPLTRLFKSNASRHITGWSYSCDDIVCASCASAKDNNKDVVVKDYLVDCGLERRYRFNDSFLAFLSWLSKVANKDDHIRLASLLLFNWHSFYATLLEMSDFDKKEDFSDYTNVNQIIPVARFFLQSFIEDGGGSLAEDMKGR